MEQLESAKKYHSIEYQQLLKYRLEL